MTELLIVIRITLSFIYIALFFRYFTEQQTNYLLYFTLQSVFLNSLDHFIAASMLVNQLKKHDKSVSVPYSKERERNNFDNVPKQMKNRKA